MNKRSLLLIIYLTITGCNMDCVEPGLQSRNTSINVDIPVRKDKEAQIYWVDSGQVISKDEEIKFTLGGSVNFCPPKEGKNPRKVLVPAVFCADGSIPNYSKAANINNVPNDYGIDEKDVSRDELCGGRGFGDEEAYSRRRYIDTGIKVDPGDKLSFSLVPREMIIDYDNLTDKDISFDDNCYRTEKGDEKVPVGEILSISEKEGKEFFCDGQDGKRNKVKFLPLDKAKAKKSMVLVGNGYTPYDNKVHFDKGYVENAWMNGALLDLRQAKIGLDELCDKKNCGFSKVKDYKSTKTGLNILCGEENCGFSKVKDYKSTKTGLNELCEEKHCDLNEIRKYSSYELNCYYQNICYTKKGIWNYKLSQAGERNCVSSVRYKKYDNEDGKCDMYSHLGKIKSKIEEVKKNAGPIDIVIPNTKDISWAEALVAKISDPGDTNISENEREDMKDTAEGTQCLPEKGEREGNACSKISGNFKDFSDFSLELNSNYEVKNVASGSSVMLAIADYGHYYRNRGGYHVKVTRSCEYAKGEKLYMYLGDSLPEDTLTASNSDFKEVSGLTSVIEDNIKYYKIDGSHLEKDKSKKIYFGVDVSNVEKEDITDKEGKYYENNKYIVTLFVKRKINDFISSNVEMVFDFIKKEIIGNSIEESYKGYAKGLLKGVRALLTLYIIFTVVGYMLGTLQLSKFDFIVRVMKIAFIAFVFSDKSWELFGLTLSNFFVDGSTYLVDSFSGYVGEEGRKFAFLDLTAGVLFTGETWLKFLSLMFAGPFGFIAFLIILHASFMFLKCIISATFRYVISTILVAFLLSLTPLFIVFILFQQTKSLFESWIKTLAHVAIQPVILLSSLSILNQLMYSVLYNLTNFSACYQCLISINFLSYDFCLMKSILPLGYSPGTSVDVALSTGEKAGGYFAALPIDLIQAFIYLIIAGAMEAFLAVSETMAQVIFSSGWGIMNGVKNAADGASQSILSAVGLDDKTQGMISHKSMMSKDRTELEVKSKQSVGKDKQSSPPDEKKKGTLQKKEVLKNIRTRMDNAKDKKED